MLNKSESTIASFAAAAEEMFVRRTYAGVSMREIAEAAEVTTGVLPHHFPSKEQLFYEMMTTYRGPVRQASVEATPPDGDCRETLRLLTRVFLALPPEQRGLMNLVRRDINVFKGRTREGLVRACQATVPDRVEAVVRDGIRRGEVKRRDARWLAWAYVAIIDTTLADHAEHKLGTMDERLDDALNVFLHRVGVTRAD